MYPIFVVLHVIVCVMLCVVVLLQSSKGGGLAGAFGGGGGLPQQIFGSRGMTTILHKLTIWLAAGFFLTSTALFALSARREPAARSVVREAAQAGRVTSDVTPPPATDVFDPNAALPGAGADAAPATQPPAAQPPAAETTGR